MSELTAEGRRQLESLLTELEAAIREDRPARWVVDGNGMDQTGMPQAERRADAVHLRDEVKARLAGEMTPARALGEAVERLNREGWPATP